MALLLAAPLASVDWDEPQQRVDVGAGRHIHLRCMGTGSPVVILTSGLGESGENWRTVMPRLAEQTRVCGWDRAGMGFSDPTTLPQDAVHTTGDLEQALRHARIKPPYVMVGHSIGSFETLLFTYRHPRDVAGMVLVDPSSPYQNRAFGVVAPRFAAATRQRAADRNAALVRCIEALENSRPDAPECGNPAPGKTIPQRIGIAHSVASLGEEMDGSSSAELISAQRSLGNLPLIVLTAGKPFPLPDDLAAEEPAVRRAWINMHDVLAAQSSRGSNRIVDGAGHYIHRDNPDAVISAIREVVSDARLSRKIR